MRNQSERLGGPPDAERVEQICHAALARDSIARDAFVAEACAGDERLRYEVESLLRSCLTPTGFCPTQLCWLPPDGWPISPATA
jgi:hypothetical protein